MQDGADNAYRATVGATGNEGIHKPAAKLLPPNGVHNNIIVLQVVPNDQIRSFTAPFKTPDLLLRAFGENTEQLTVLELADDVVFGVFQDPPDTKGPA